MKLLLHVTSLRKACDDSRSNVHSLEAHEGAEGISAEYVSSRILRSFIDVPGILQAKSWISWLNAKVWLSCTFDQHLSGA